MEEVQGSADGTLKRCAKNPDKRRVRVRSGTGQLCRSLCDFIWHCGDDAFIARNVLPVEQMQHVYTPGSTVDESHARLSAVLTNLMRYAHGTGLEESALVAAASATAGGGVGAAAGSSARK